MTQIDLSLVLPVYNEAQTVPHLAKRLLDLQQQLPHDLELEVIFVNDGSQDESAALLHSLVLASPKYKLINFSRNFGHQAAITAGINAAQGRAVIVMDADLQDPPELICNMAQAWQQGAEIVIAKRDLRLGETLFKRLTAGLFYRLLARMTQVPIVLDAGDFYLLDRKVVNVLNACPERSRFLRGLVAWAGFKKTVIPYQRDARQFGTTHYTLKKMFSLAKDALFGFSETPIAFIHGSGLLSMFIALVAGIHSLYAFFAHETVAGWTSMVLLLSFFGGLILLSLGIVAEYVFRIFKETQARPFYVISECIDAHSQRQASRIISAKSRSATQPNSDSAKAGLA